MDSPKLVVGIADMKSAKGDGMLVTYALGSCIGICLRDAVSKVGALIHIMLPYNVEGATHSAMKYANTGLRETLKQMEAMGAARRNITAKIAGGAKMFEVSGGGALGNIGQRNVDSVRLNLRQEGIRLMAEDVGGTVARTLLFDVATGQVCIRCYGRPEQII